MYFQERRTRECRTLIHKLIIANVCSKSFPIIESCFDCCSTSVFTVAFSQLYGGVVTVVWRCCHSCMEVFSQLYGGVVTVVWRCMKAFSQLLSAFQVCLSILNTWHGRPEEKWNPQTSSFLQVSFLNNAFDYCTISNNENNFSSRSTSVFVTNPFNLTTDQL